VVASAGTALTTAHLKELKRFSGDIRLAFDEDRAGQEAAMRAIPLAQSLGGIDLSIISVPEGKDPDELIKRDPKLWQNAVVNPRYMVDWLIDRVASSLDISTAPGKRSLIEQIVGIIRHLKDPVEREHYSKKLADMTNTSLTTIQEKIYQQPLHPKRLKTIKTPAAKEAKLTQEQRVREQHLLALCMKHKSIGKILSGVPDDVFSEEAQNTARFIAQAPGVSPTDSEYGTMLGLLYEEYYQHSDEDELTYQARHLVSRLVHAYAKTKKSALALEMEQTDSTNQKTLLKAIKQLDDLVAQFSALTKIELNLH
jgi:DNA primase